MFRDETGSPISSGLRVARRWQRGALGAGLQVILALTIFASAPSTASATPTREDPRDAGKGWGPREWSGDRNTLPLNRPWLDVLQYARELRPVQAAKQAALGRGYIPRPDLEIALVGDNYAAATLMYEIPGRDIRREMFIVQVITIGGGIESESEQDLPCTQIFGMMLADSSGIPLMRATPTDSAFVVVRATGDEGRKKRDRREEAGPTRVEDAFRIAFTYSAMAEYGTRRNQSRWQVNEPAQGADAQELLHEWSREVEREMIDGAVTGGMGGVGRALLQGRFWSAPGEALLWGGIGAVYGAYSADRRFWLNHPDTTRRPR